MRHPLLASVAALAATCFVTPAHAEEAQTTTPPTTISATPTPTEKAPAKEHEDCAKKGDSAGHKSAHSTEGEHSKSPAPKAKAATTVTYVCPMHPEVTSDKKGRCPKCNMFLEPKK